ncbi:hypothetical protein D1AOALGA4SA_9320 [Olavius algarvensis Delta 1 endosymbiont]|nr:hypothetical protein D1AOALGA4SA_9320 [Olavius algarvensis Delta 1 endosymbiont]
MRRLYTLICRRKPGPLGHVRDNWLCRETCCQQGWYDGIS